MLKVQITVNQNRLQDQWACLSTSNKTTTSSTSSTRPSSSIKQGKGWSEVSRGLGGGSV